MRANLQVNFDPGQDWCENKAKFIRRARDSTSGNLTSVREKSRGVCLELFDDISLMINVRRLCVVVDSLTRAAKVCDCVISAWC